MKKFILTECKICGKKLNSRGFSFHYTKIDSRILNLYEHIQQ
jgi:NAD dependent epimerase/dehydratase family enzyme